MRSLFVSTLLASAFVVVTACSGDDGNTAGAIDAAVDSPPGEVGTFTVKWGPATIPAGTEDTACVQVRLGNAGAIKVHEIHNLLGDASHHFILYRTSSTEEYTTPRPCNPFAGTLDPSQGAPMMITQRAEETLTLPDDVAFTLPANQMMRLELHYLNATKSPQMVEVTSELRTQASASIEADFLFIGNPDINLPAMRETTLGPTFITLPPELRGVNVFAVTGHTHKLGTDVTVSTARSADDPGTSVYATSPFSWSEPETVFHRPAFTIPEGFKFTCKYNNTTTRTVQFGEATDEEMCFFWAYYYPSRGAKVCAHYRGTDLCCPGNPLCAILGL